ncbi:MAG: hypothetical protein KDA97_11990, partial [Acidimicrobiales bacterium]|nr:hypothetical protein [Acidimicrobiales bacterium]
RLDPDQRLADYIVEAMADLVELVRSDPNLVAVFADDSRAAAGRVVGGSNALRSQSRAFIDRVLADAS